MLQRDALGRMIKDENHVKRWLDGLGLTTFQYASQYEQTLLSYRSKAEHVGVVICSSERWGSDNKSAGHTADKPNAAMSFGEYDLQSKHFAGSR